MNPGAELRAAFPPEVGQVARPRDLLEYDAGADAVASASAIAAANAFAPADALALAPARAIAAANAVARAFADARAVANAFVNQGDPHAVA